MARAALLVLDSVGCGGAADADAYGDAGANTLLHIAEACALGDGDRRGLRAGPLALPHLSALGLGRAIEASCGVAPPGFDLSAEPDQGWGYGIERSKGKDTPSGHWEMAGTILTESFGYFPDTDPAFPPDLVAALVARADLPGILGDRHASGTEIIEDCGEAHIRTGKPICYTSVDSVLQIAAHEGHFGLERLYDVCRIARQLCDPLHIGRVIARPFVGERRGAFQRTPRRKDFAMPPPPGNLFERAAEAERAVVSIGKIGDIFAHRDTGREIKGVSNLDHIDRTIAALADLADGGLLFANFVDFDSEFGHRRDVPGYAAALEAFDARLPDIRAALRPGDLCVIAADHGNDPTFRGTDHTREHVPILAFGPGAPAMRIGRRETFADIGASLARWLGLAATKDGRSWL